MLSSIPPFKFFLSFLKFGDPKTLSVASLYSYWWNIIDVMIILTFWFKIFPNNSCFLKHISKLLWGFYKVGLFITWYFSCKMSVPFTEESAGSYFVGVITLCSNMFSILWIISLDHISHRITGVLKSLLHKYWQEHEGKKVCCHLSRSRCIRVSCKSPGSSMCFKCLLNGNNVGYNHPCLLRWSINSQ